MTVAKIEVKGIREFQKALRDMDRDLPKQMRLVFNSAVGMVITYAEARFPRRSGRAVGSLKAKSSQREARVSLGGARAKYAAWLDFGGEGRVKGRPPHREFIKSGRYVYKGLEVHRTDIIDAMSKGLTDLATGAGLEVR